MDVGAQIGLAIIGLVAIHFLLRRFSKKSQSHNDFVKEYLEVLNNPSYKVKKE